VIWSASLVEPVLQDSFLGDLVTEISMQTAATEATYAAAQATAAQLLQVSKDQYILFKHDIQSLPMPMRQADSAEHIVHSQASSRLTTCWHRYMLGRMCSVTGLWYKHINCTSATHNSHPLCLVRRQMYGSNERHVQQSKL